MSDGTRPMADGAQAFSEPLPGATGARLSGPAGTPRVEAPPPRPEAGDDDSRPTPADLSAKATPAAKGFWGRWVAPLKQTVMDFIEDDCLTQAGAVAFYTALSFAPLMVLIILLTGTFLGPGMQEAVVEEVQAYVGPAAGEGVKDIQEAGREQAQTATFFTFAGLIGIGILLWSASAVFAQLQAAMNVIWDVEPDPEVAGVWDWLRKRLLSIGMIFGILFLLLASFMVSTVLNAVLGRIAGEGAGWIWIPVNWGVSLTVYFGLFLMVFKFLPDANVPWRTTLLGAAATAVLFAVGEELIRVYLAYGNVGETYGGAGGLVVLLVWVYYSALIVFFGAEMTQSFSKAWGYPATPQKHARRERGKQKKPAVVETRGT